MNRIYHSRLKHKLLQHKLLLLLGPKGVGKELIVKEVLNDLGEKPHVFDASNKKEFRKLQGLKEHEITVFFKNYPFVIITEAQLLSNLQKIVELVLTGQINTTLILNCSFLPALDEILIEALEIQGLSMKILPTTFYELAQKNNITTEEKLIEQRLVFGNYDAVTNHLNQAPEFLTQLVESIQKSKISVKDRVNKQKEFAKMLQILAFNIGEPISYNEIGEQCGLDNETVERYTSILVQSSILIKLSCFHTEKRYELKKTHVFYFIDNGIRNAIICNLNPIHLRNDIDLLWRNWLIAERIKWNELQGNDSKYYFWRTHTKQYIPFIENQNQQWTAYTTAWEKKKKLKFPDLFQSYYPNLRCSSLNRSTYWTFLSKKTTVEQ